MHRPHTTGPEPTNNTEGPYAAGVTRLSWLKTAGHNGSSHMSTA